MVPVPQLIGPVASCKVTVTVEEAPTAIALGAATILEIVVGVGAAVKEAARSSGDTARNSFVLELAFISVFPSIICSGFATVRGNRVHYD